MRLQDLRSQVTASEARNKPLPVQICGPVSLQVRHYTDPSLFRSAVLLHSKCGAIQTPSCSDLRSRVTASEWDTDTSLFRSAVPRHSK